MARAAMLSIVLTACGRVAFDPRDDARMSDDGVDAAAIINCPRGEFCLEPVPTTQDLFGVWARSAADVWAVGRNGTILHRTDGAWRAVSSGTTDQLHAVWAAPEADTAIAVGQNARTIRLSGETVRSSTSGGPVLNSVWGFSNDRFYIVGSSGTVSRCDAATCVSDSGNVVGVLFRIYGSEPDDVWIGSLGNDLFHAQNGGPWQPTDPGTSDTDWFDVWANSPNDVWVVGYSVAHFDGTTWTPIDASAFGVVFDVAHGDASTAWFYGSEGLGVWRGGAIEPTPSTIVGTMHDVHGAGGVVWFVGDGGAIYVHQP